MDNRKEAKKLLVHYFKLAFSFPANGDVVTEIETIVDCIIDAVKQEIIQELADTLQEDS